MLLKAQVYLEKYSESEYFFKFLIHKCLHVKRTCDYPYQGRSFHIITLGINISIS